jgi:hypothetical protein
MDGVKASAETGSVIGGHAHRCCVADHVASTRVRFTHPDPSTLEFGGVTDGSRVTVIGDGAVD